MSRSWAVLLLLALGGPGHAALIDSKVRKPGAGPYFRIHRGKLWGFMDDKGKTVIPAQFDEVGDFFTGLARVRKAGLWGYIDEKGSLKLPYRFDSALDFVEGLAPVRLGRGWGVINPAGNWVVQPNLGAIAEFSNGLARFEDWDQLECDFDGKGMVRYTKASATDIAFILHDGSGDDLGLIPCKGGKFGYLDLAGKTAIPSQFDVAFDFSDDRAIIRKLKDGYLAYGVIDKSGSIVVEPQYDFIAPFSEGVASVIERFESNKSGIIDKDGRFVINPEYFYIGPFSEGLAAACPRNESCGFIDHSGRFIVLPRFSSARPFSEGLSLVWSEDERLPYYVDHAGHSVLKLGWTAWPFSGGLTVMTIGDLYAYVDHDGKVVGTYEAPGR